MCNQVLSGYWDWTDLHGLESSEQAPVAENSTIMLYCPFPAFDAPQRVQHETVLTALLALLQITINEVQKELLRSVNSCDVVTLTIRKSLLQTKQKSKPQALKC